MASKRQIEREAKKLARVKQTLLPAIAPDQKFVLAQQEEQQKLDQCSDQVSLASSLKLVRYLIASDLLKDNFVLVPELLAMEERLVRTQLGLAMQNDYHPSIERLASQSRLYTAWATEALREHGIDATNGVEAIKHYFSVVLDRRIIASLNQKQIGETIDLPLCDQQYKVAEQSILEASSDSLGTSSSLKLTRYMIQRHGLDDQNIPFLLKLIRHEDALVRTTYSIAKRAGMVTTKDTAAKLESWLAVIIGAVLRQVIQDRHTLESVYDNIIKQATRVNEAAGSPIDGTMLPILNMELGDCDDELARILTEPARIENQ
jgi:hypothetical protein